MVSEVLEITLSGCEESLEAAVAHYEKRGWLRSGDQMVDMDEFGHMILVQKMRQIRYEMPEMVQ